MGTTLPQRIVWDTVGTEEHHQYHPDDIPRDRLLTAIKSRTFQSKRGDREQKTQAAHHLNHSDMRAIILHDETMTNVEILELARFVDGATMVQDEKYNKQHTKWESEIRNNRKTGKSISGAAKDRVLRYIGRIATGFCKDVLCASNARRMIEFYKSVFYKEIPVLKHYLEDVGSRVHRDVELRARQFRSICRSVLKSVYQDISLFIRKHQLHLDHGKVTENSKSALEVNGFLKFTTKGLVDKRCIAYRLRLVELDGVFNGEFQTKTVTVPPDLILESDVDSNDEDNPS
jgi:hypothetical protein